MQCQQCQRDWPDEFRVCPICTTPLAGTTARAEGGSAATVGDGNISVAGSVSGHIIMAQEGSTIHLAAPESGPGAGPAALRRAYLSRVAAACNVLPLAYIDPRAGERAREQAMTLAAVYTALDTTMSLSALEAATLDRRMVLLGGPGSGKSTFGRWLTLLLARASLEPTAGWLESLDPFWSYGTILPVFVILRDFSASPHCDGTAGGLWAFIAATLAADGLGDYAPHLRDELLKGGVFVYLDGLDEVSDPNHRLAVRNAVQAFVEVYNHTDNRFLVSCRPYAYADLAGFPTHTLAPFSPVAIDAFIEAWYAEVRALDWKTAAEAAELTIHLQTAVRRPDLAPLASNPLQLTMMASLHTSWGRLPDDRAVLYHEMVELLLVRWQEARLGPTAGVSQQVSSTELRRALEHVAFQAHREHSRSTGMANIRELDLIAALRDCAGGSLDGAATLANYIHQRAGLLVEREVGVYTFPHRSYQEYLAGCHLAVQPDFPDRAAALVWDAPSQWHETVLWAVAVMARVKNMTHVAVDAVSALCPHEASTRGKLSHADWHAVWLAGEALLEVGTAKLEGTRYEIVLNRVWDWLAALVAGGYLALRERAAVGRVLGTLGDPRPDVACDVPFTVEIPAGTFLMGSTKETVEQWNREGDTEPLNSERPQHNNELLQHKVTLLAYRIGKYPVTGAQYRRFVEDGGYTEKQRGCWTTMGWTWREEKGITTPRYWDDPAWTVPNHPVIGVSWYEAVAYCQWLSKTTGERFRLPTEAEWERASRGTDGPEWPWGDEWDVTRCNSEEAGVGSTTAVGLFPGGASLDGVLDMAGSVWEWCATKWQDNYQNYRNDNELEGVDTRVLRGGSFGYDRRFARCAFRFGIGQDTRARGLGFRVVLASPCGADQH